jgi:EmrB/QacA subfamily drug resistance transporter
MKITPIPKKWWVLFAMSLALAIMFLDQTAVSVALPAMQLDLNANNTEIQWIVNAYLLTTACILILGGKLGDMFGYKNMFIIGVLIFIISSATIALAQVEMEAIISRAVQGIGAALMIPGSNVIVFNAFGEKERGRALGIQVSIASLFLCLGPMLGGYFTEFMSWRYIFWINLPIGLLACIIVYRFSPQEANLPPRKPLDWKGFWLSLVALFCIVFALMQTAEWGWGNPYNLTLLAVGLALTYWFIRFERTKEHPFVDLNLFKDRGFLVGTLILLLVQTNFIARIFTAIFFQLVLGYSPFVAGLLALASTIPILFAGIIGGYLKDLYGSRLPVVIGSWLIALSSFWIAGFAWAFNYWYLVPGLIAFACGAPLVISTARTVALTTIPAEQRGSATGVCNSARNVGGTLGLALMSTIIINLQKWHLNHSLSELPAPFNHLNADKLSGVLSGAETATEHLFHLNHEQYHTLHTAAEHAYTFGYSVSMVFIGMIGLLGLYFANKLPRD